MWSKKISGINSRPSAQYTDMDREPPGEADQYEQFLRLFSRDQLRVMAYIRSVIHDYAAAGDVFQETSFVLWRRFESYDRELEFLPWPLGIARNQVRKHWRSISRDRHVFSYELVSELSDEAIGLAGEIGPRQHALEQCVRLLNQRQRDLIHRFYGENQSATSIAQVWNRSVHAVYKALKVMRRSLLECVESRLARENP